MLHWALYWALTFKFTKYKNYNSKIILINFEDMILKLLVVFKVEDSNASLSLKRSNAEFLTCKDEIKVSEKKQAIQQG